MDSDSRREESLSEEQVAQRTLEEVGRVVGNMKYDVPGDPLTLTAKDRLEIVREMVAVRPTHCEGIHSGPSEESFDLRGVKSNPIPATATPTPSSELSVWMRDFKTPTPDPTPTIPSADSSCGPSRMGDLEDPNKAITSPFPLAERGKLTRLERLAIIRGDFPPREESLNTKPSAPSAEQPEADPQQEIRRLETVLEDLYDRKIDLQYQIFKAKGAHAVDCDDISESFKAIPLLLDDETLRYIQQLEDALVMVTNMIAQTAKEIRHLQQILAYQNSAFGRAHAALRRFFDKFKHRENVRS